MMPAADALPNASPAGSPFAAMRQSQSLPPERNVPAAADLPPKLSGSQNSKWPAAASSEESDKRGWSGVAGLISDLFGVDNPVAGRRSRPAIRTLLNEDKLVILSALAATRPVFPDGGAAVVTDRPARRRVAAPRWGTFTGPCPASGVVPGISGSWRISEESLCATATRSLSSPRPCGLGQAGQPRSPSFHAAAAVRIPAPYLRQCHDRLEGSAGRQPQPALGNGGADEPRSDSIEGQSDTAL